MTRRTAREGTTGISRGVGGRRTRRVRTRTLVWSVLVALLAASCAERTDLVAERADAPSTNPPRTTAESTTTRAADESSTTTSTAPTTTTTAPPALEVVPLAGGPVRLARRVVAAERIARNPESSPAAAEAAAFEAQILYRQLARRPEWRDRVLAEVDPRWHRTINANVDARREFRAMHHRLSDEVPPWRIVDPPPIDELLGYYRAGEAEFGVPWEILAGVHLVETGIGRIEGTSSAGAQGPMQFIPSTWEAYGNGGDIRDHADAIRGAARYLAANGGGSGDLDNALFRYNNSNHYVRGVKLYASVIAERPDAYRAFYHWQIVYLTEVGELWLPTGYDRTTTRPVVDYVADFPDRVITTATG